MTTTTEDTDPLPHGLHLGCGKHLLAGWLNSDLRADPCRGVIGVDATRRLPFDDGVFERVFSEHMIEHIPYSSGVQLVEECFRVLRPGGVIRISTPDFRFLVNLYLGSSRGIRADYVRWSTERFIPWADGYDPLFVANNFVRCWGHQFIYDEEVLGRVMEAAGFRMVSRRRVQESAYPALRNLENSGRMPPGFLELESVILEGKKPVEAA